LLITEVFANNKQYVLFIMKIQLSLQCKMNIKTVYLSYASLIYKKRNAIGRIKKL